MLVVGSLVEFNWWSDYMALAVIPDHNGHSSWHTIHPGDTGIVLEVCECDDTVTVLFSGVNKHLRIHVSMLRTII